MLFVIIIAFSFVVIAVFAAMAPVDFEEEEEEFPVFLLDNRYVNPHH